MTTNRKRHLSAFALFLIQFQLICQMLAEFSVVESERTLFRLKKRNKNCVLFAYFIKRAREISQFHAVVVLRRLRNVQKSMMHVQSCCFAIYSHCFFANQAPHCCDPKILLPW